MADTDLEFSAQAFCKMVMHAMKYPHSVCSGLLLSPKPSNTRVSNRGGAPGISGRNMEIINELSATDNNGVQQLQDGGDSDDEDRPDKTRIIEAIPISHASQCLAPNLEIAFNSVSIFAQEQELVISGYYQTDRYNEPSCSDSFSQKVAGKICESYPNAVLCFVSFEGPSAQTLLDPHQLIDGKWRRKPPHSFKVEGDVDVLANTILYSKEKLYRKIVDFDEHFDNISLDWTNPKIGQRIDHMIANVC